MIKRISLVRRASCVAPGGFADAWRGEALRLHDAAPPDARPCRLAHCVVREGRTPPPHHGVELAWFADDAALPEYDRWIASAVHAGDPAIDDSSTSSVLVEERAALGEGWLAARWLDVEGGARVVLLGFIERAAALTRVAFRDYWWGQHRPLADALVPPELRPMAYVHNYVRTDEDFAWDGIGEIYETSLEVATARGQWFGSDAAVPLVADEPNFMIQATRIVVLADHHVIVVG